MGDKADLEIPAGRRHIIERPRLTRLLDETSARVIMLVAPAGYGKTTLARQWLASRRHGWYQANAASADVAALALGLSDAISGFSNGSGRKLREWLSATSEPDRDVDLMASLVLGEPGGCSKHFILAIDDYHWLDSPASEALVAAVLRDSTAGLLITSRYKPRWATPRRLLYGEIAELGQNVLAMTHEEAGEVLASDSNELTSAIVALANGWPAFIGLAALTDLSGLLAEESLPPQLYDYIAEELYAAVDVGTRTGLCELSLFHGLSTQFAKDLLGDRAGAVLRRGVHGGFISHTGGTFELHPLLRTFLLHKFADLDLPVRTAAINRAFNLLLNASAWEEAFALLVRVSRYDLVEPLVAASLDDLTQHGRVETLRVWAARGRAAGIDAPALTLLEAECAFRSGSHERARTLSKQASASLPAESPLASKAYYRAGQNAHLSDAPHDAIDNFRRARKLAKAITDSRNAIWGEFITSVELERTAAHSLLEEFVKTDTETVDDLVRIQNGRLYLGTRFGPLEDAVSGARPIVTLVPDARDPIIRISFWHTYAAALRLATYYDDAHRAVADGLKETSAFHLDFARPHMLLIQAASSIGVRRFAEASAILEFVQTLSEEHEDEYLSMSARAMRCRLLLTEGAPDAALASTTGSWLRVSSRGQRAEFLASRALAYGRMGHLDRAHELLGEARVLSGELEARCLCIWATTLLKLQAGVSDPEKIVISSFDETVAAGMLDMLVFAYRLDDRVLPILASDASRQVLLSEVLTRACDRSLARRASLTLLPPDQKRAPFPNLTERERDVFEFIKEAKSNKEIAQALFLSEPTVKVHVRSILKKLGVRTRTEAAIVGSRASLPNS